jgi:hypothetical protein
MNIIALSTRFPIYAFENEVVTIPSNQELISIFFVEHECDLACSHSSAR